MWVVFFKCCKGQVFYRRWVGDLAADVEDVEAAGLLELVVVDAGFGDEGAALAAGLVDVETGGVVVVGLVGLSGCLETSVVVMVGRELALEMAAEAFVLACECLDVTVAFIEFVDEVVVEALWFNLNMLAVESVLRGGSRSFTLSSVLASSNEIFFWSSESDPITTLALSRVDLPPERAPSGSVPVGVRPLSVSTLSLSSRSVVNTLAILPMALILLRMISLRATTPSWSASSANSCSEQIFKILTNISVTFSPTNGSDQVNTSMKLGNQYGCGEQLN